MQQGMGTRGSGALGAPGAGSRRRLLAAGATAFGAVLAGACGAGTQTSTGTGSTQAGQSGGSRSLAAATLGWDTFRGFTPATEWPRMMTESFQAKFPNVKVDARAIGLDAGNQQSAYPKMLAMLQAGTLGEVHAWDPSHWQLYQAVKRNIIRPIDEFVARDKFDLKQYYAPFIEYQKWQGKLWGLPSWGWTGNDGILYNTELARQAGVTFPDQNSPDWTMNKLYEIAVKMGRFAERAGGFGLRTTLPGTAGVTVLARAFNSDNLSPDGKKSTLMDAAPKEAMKWAYDLAHKEKVVAIPGTYEGDPFLAGTLGIDHQGSLTVFNVNRANANGLLKFKAQLFPKRKDGKRPSQLRGGTWNILGPGNKLPDHAWEFIKHITSREGALLFNTDGGNQAQVRPDIMDDKYFQDPNFKVYLENFENAMVHVVPANLRGTEFETAYNEKGPTWYKGEVGFEDGLKVWNDEVQRVLDQPEV
jgi:multiple sugar transport system substrate-binding protein